MLCSLLKALLVLHCKLALYYVQQSGAASQRSVQTCLPRACIVTRVEGVGSSRTRGLCLDPGTSFSRDSHLSYNTAQAIV